MRKLYWAYGSNLNIEQMNYRCPAAVPIEPLTVKNLVLRFRGVADVAYLTGAHCEGGLWEITDECEDALDDYEGVGPRGFGGLYRKCYFDYADPDTGEIHKVLYYKMNRTGIMPPSEGYLDCIVKGYADFGIDTERLRKAVDHSWRRKDMNGFLAYRWQKAGKPKMARPERIVAIDAPFDPDPEPAPDVPLPLFPVPSKGKKSKRERKAERKAAFDLRVVRDVVEAELARKQPVSKEPLPDICLRVDPDNSNWCRAVTVTDKGVDYFEANIRAEMVETEWLFKFNTHVVAGLLQKKGLTVAILEKLRSSR